MLVNCKTEKFKLISCGAELRVVSVQVESSTYLLFCLDSDLPFDLR